MRRRTIARYTATPLCSDALGERAVETEWHVVAQVRDRNRIGLEVARVHHDQPRAMLGGRVDHRQEPAVVLGGVGPPRHEDRLTRDMAGAELVARRGAGLMVDLDDRAEGLVA